MDAYSTDALDFPALRELLAARTQTAHGRSLAAQLEPVAGIEEVRRLQRLTRDATRYFREHQGFGLGGLEELTPILELLRIENTRLEAPQLLRITQWIDAAQNLRLMFSDLGAEVPDLAALARRIPDLRPLAHAIREKILPSGEVDDRASEELQQVRRDAHRLRDRIHRRLQAVLRDSPEAAIQDEIITVRNNRFVVPVSSSHRREVPGVIHAVSGSGATVFIEPIETIESNNELIRLLELEQAEIARILLELANRLRENRERLEALIQLVADFDLLGAKARLAIDLDGVEPVISEEVRLRLVDVRHPLLEESLRRRQGRVVPVSLEIDEAHRTLIISGPNAGGKTVVLKTAGLCALMAQSGLQIPAREAELPVFGQVLAEIGDHQSIAANLSTFTAHIQAVREITEVLGDRALVLLDEAGTGTDPDEGAAMAVAMVDYFRRRGAITLVTTHFNALKSYGYLTPGVLNAAVEFDEKNLRPTFHLLSNLAGSSNGIEIARRIGLDEEIVAESERLARQSDQEARRFLARLKEELEHQAALRAALEEERAVTAAKFQGLEQDFKSREAARWRELEAQFEAVTAQFRTRADQLLQSVKDQGARVSLQKTVGRKFAGLAASSQEGLKPPMGERARLDPSALPREVRVGDMVTVRGLGRTGKVERIEDDQLTIAIGLLKWKARREDVEFSESKGTSAPGLPAGVFVHTRARERLSTELNLIGRTVEEALEQVDQFLDQAVLAAMPEVRIIHGSGTGALRKAIRAMLEKHPHVLRFRPATAQEGAGGATVVQLRLTEDSGDA